MRKPELKLPLNTMEVLGKRYLLRDENQRIVETPLELFHRVARGLALAEYSGGCVGVSDDKT